MLFCKGMELRDLLETIPAHLKQGDDSIKTNCSNYKFEIEFRVRMMPHLRHFFLMRHFYPKEKLCIPLGLRICHPEVVLDYPPENVSPKNCL